MLEEVVKMETSKGSAAFDEETPAKSDKKRKGGVPKAKAEDDDGGASQRDPAGRRRKRARGDRSDVILEGKRAWAFCFPTHVDPLFVFLVNNRRELWRRRSVFPALNVVQWQLAPARWFFQVHVWAGTVWNPATG